jgi:cell wall-associated NlpC family hydrolase
MTTPDQIIAEARQLIGLPFRHHGRGPFGFDCLGVVLKTAWANGLVPDSYDFKNYTQNVADYELEQHLNDSPYVQRLSSWQEAQPADILLQRFHSSLPASHLIVISDRQGQTLWGIHASRRGVVEQRIAHLERNRAAFRLKEVQHG